MTRHVPSTDDTATVNPRLAAGANRPARHTPAGRRFHNPRRGFTIVELLVAVSILSVMLFLINTLFYQTTTAVSAGVRASTVLAVGRSVQDRVSRDVSAMMGPNATNPVPQGGGYIIIINKAILAPVKRENGQEVIERFRVDQLVFMADAQAAASKVSTFRGGAPRDPSQFSSDFKSPFALIRYGHGRRTERDGSDLGGWTELGFNRNSGLDRLANDWILTRQAVLFEPTDSQNNLINTASDWHVQVPFMDANVLPGPSPWPAEIDHIMDEGYCDITSANPKLFVDNYLNPADPLTLGLTPSGIDAAYMSLTGADQRLRVNPIPAAAGDDFPAWKVGQLHGVFASNCSDFIVQFAADVDNDGQIDRLNPATGDNTGTEADGDPIFWYDINTIGLLPTAWDRSSASADDNAPWLPFNYLGAISTGPIDFQNHADTAFIFRVEDNEEFTTAGDPDNSKWPYMIRIRYRLHDAPGKLESNASARLFDGIDNDNDGIVDEGSDGIDNNGGGTVDEEAEKDEARISGRYFEQIIRVPRPQNP